MKQLNTSNSRVIKAKGLWGTLIVTVALLILIGGWVIPFKFESFSILYKFGTEKTYLRCGKLIGITLVVLVFYQIILASRLIILERIFSLKHLLKLHRTFGILIGVLILMHPLLIKASENLVGYTFEKKYYPEFLGFAVFALLLATVCSGIFKKYIKLSYKGWLILHRCLVTMVLLAMPAHVLFVSESFKAGPPRTFALTIFALNLVLLTRIWLRRFFS